MVLTTFGTLQTLRKLLRPGTSRSSTEFKDVLDASHPALQHLLIGFEWIPTGYERANWLRPALPEDAQILNSCLKGVFPRIHGPQNDLIFQDEVPHDAVCLYFNGFYKTWNPREHEDTVGS